MIKKVIKDNYVIEFSDTSKYTQKEIDQMIDDSLAFLSHKEKQEEPKRDIIVECPYRYNEVGHFYISEEGYKKADQLDANDMLTENEAEAHHFNSLEEVDRFVNTYGIEDYQLTEFLHSDVDDVYVEDCEIEVIPFEKEE